MNDEQNEKPPNVCDEEVEESAFERFQSLARRLLAVPREEITNREEEEEALPQPEPQEA